MALMLSGLFGVGLYMADLPLSPWKLKVFSWHKWAGVTVFLLVWLRLLWRVTHRPPTLPDAMPALMKWVAHGGHLVLYVLMLAIPVSGWLMSSAKGFQTVYFGILPLPDLVPKDKELGKQLADLHEALAWFLALVVTGHAAAAFKHHFIDRDDILARMVPGVQPRTVRSSSTQAENRS
jgi:cytochrome b561